MYPILADIWIIFLLGQIKKNANLAQTGRTNFSGKGFMYNTVIFITSTDYNRVKYEYVFRNVYVLL